MISFPRDRDVKKIKCTELKVGIFMVNIQKDLVVKVPDLNLHCFISEQNLQTYYETLNQLKFSFIRDVIFVMENHTKSHMHHPFKWREITDNGPLIPSGVVIDNQNFGERYVYRDHSNRKTVLGCLKKLSLDVDGDLHIKENVIKIRTPHCLNNSPGQRLPAIIGRWVELWEAQTVRGRVVLNKSTSPFYEQYDPCGKVQPDDVSPKDDNYVYDPELVYKERLDKLDFLVVFGQTTSPDILSILSHASLYMPSSTCTVVSIFTSPYSEETIGNNVFIRDEALFHDLNTLCVKGHVFVGLGDAKGLFSLINRNMLEEVNEYLRSHAIVFVLKSNS